ncbi:MAG: hypothetical protein WBA74_11070, partial [Cyclobacteriaceae bacterium]
MKNLLIYSNHRFMFSLLTVIFLCGQILYGQEKVETKYYTFKTDYWFNMHHFLYQEALLQSEDSTMLRTKLKGKNNKILKSSLEYYSEYILNKDLRTDSTLQAFKLYLYKAEGLKDLDAVPEKFKNLALVLTEFDETYRQHFWEEQRQH